MRTRIFTIQYVLLSLLATVVIGLLCSLGVWQLHRADEKSAMLMHYASMKEMKPIALLNNSDLGSIQAQLKTIENYELISIKGIYDDQIVFLLDNQFYHHELGYEVIQPVQLKNGNIILVSRGWVKAPLNRQELPKLTYPNTTQRNITGAAYFPSKSPVILGNNVDNFTTGQDWPKRIETINIPEIQQWIKTVCDETSETNVYVYPFILRLNASEPDGFVRDWPIVAMTPDRHIGYAVQWFGMALTVFIIFIVLSLKNYRKISKYKLNESS